MVRMDYGLWTNMDSALEMVDVVDVVDVVGVVVGVAISLND